MVFFLLLDLNKLFNFSWKKENQMLILQIRLFLFLFLFSFSFSFFSIFHVKYGITPLFLLLIFLFLICSMEGLFFLLLLKKDMNKWFKFYWKKETQMLILQIRFFWMDCFFFFFFFFFSFSFSHFSIFLNSCSRME